MESGHSPPPPVILFWLQLLDSSLANTLSLSHTHTKHMSPVSLTHMLILLYYTEIEVTSQQSRRKSIHVPNETPTHTHNEHRVPGQWAVSQSEPLRDPSSPGVRFLLLLLVLHELLLHLFHGALRRCPILFREDVWEGECLALCLGVRWKKKDKD